jgi:polar amino acid transport system substrate-binding protein
MKQSITRSTGIGASSKSKWLSALALAASVGLLAGCSTATEDPAPSDDKAAANEYLALMPESVRDSGKLIAGTTPTYRPYEFTAEDGKTIVGANVEVMEEIAKLMDLELVWETTAEYGSLIPGTQSGRYDASIIFEDTKERQKVVDLVDFYESGSVFLGPKGSADDPTVVCGSTVAVGTGNGPDLISGDINQELCASKGLPDITFQNFANTDGQLVALSSERVDFMFTNEAVVAVFVEENPEFSARTPVYAKTPAGIAVPKGDGTAEAFKLALETLLEDGTIQTIFEKWGLGSQPLDEVIINYQG